MQRLISLAAISAVALADSYCDEAYMCNWDVPWKGGSFNLNLRGLCNLEQDYVYEDAVGHTYYANICGYASKECIPTFQSQYTSGRVIQSWGDAPVCNPAAPACANEDGTATCCTEPCEVTAVREPTLSLIVPGDATQGFDLFYSGATSTRTDNNKCTQAPYLRTTHMQFFCDPAVDGYAHFYEADQSATNPCEYILKFKTRAACVEIPLSGGWVFIIILISVSGAYLLAAMAWNYHKTRKCGLPERHVLFFSAFNELVLEGILFTLAGCKKPRRSGGYGKGIGAEVDGSAFGAPASAPAASAPGAAGGYQAGGASAGFDRSGYSDL